MNYQGPDRADLNNVFELNAAFIDWQRARPLEDGCAGGMSPDNCGRLAALSVEQRERLARTPFLLMSLAEDDELRWQSLFAEQQTRDLLQCAQRRDQAASRLTAAGLGFLWQLAQRNPYAARLVSGASLSWCEQLATYTLMDLFTRALEDPALLAPRFANQARLWDKLLTAGVSKRRHLRFAARMGALQTVLTNAPVPPYRALAAAACRMPAARIQRSGKRGK